MPRSVPRTDFPTVGGPSIQPALDAAIEQFKLILQPQLMQDLALAGLAQSGAVGEATALGLAGITLPIFQQGIQSQTQLQLEQMRNQTQLQLAEIQKQTQLAIAQGNWQNAIQLQQMADQLQRDLANLDATLAMTQWAGNMQLQQWQLAWEAAGLPRDVQQQQAQAAFNVPLMQQALWESLTLGPLGQVLPSAAIQQMQTARQSGGLFGK